VVLEGGVQNADVVPCGGEPPPQNHLLHTDVEGEGLKCIKGDKVSLR